MLEGAAGTVGVTATGGLALAHATNPDPSRTEIASVLATPGSGEKSRIKRIPLLSHMQRSPVASSVETGSERGRGTTDALRGVLHLRGAPRNELLDVNMPLIAAIRIVSLERQLEAAHRCIAQLDRPPPKPQARAADSARSAFVLVVPAPPIRRGLRPFFG